MGRLLSEMERGKAGRPEKITDSVSVISEYRRAMVDAEINERQARRVQTIGKLPDEECERYKAETRAAGQEITSAGLLRLARKLAQESKQNGDGSFPCVFKSDESTVIIGDARNMDLSQFPSKYRVVIADPPWAYRVARGEGVSEEQYQLMTDEEIAAMPVPELAMKNCALFLWGTWPKLPEALDVMRAWGFEYVTGFPWVKTATNHSRDKPAEKITLSYGVGYWVRGVSEYILIGRKGKVSAPRLKGFMGLISPNLKHSRKPDSVHEIAEAIGGPCLELFARRARLGWTVFGNEIQDVLL